MLIYDYILNDHENIKRLLEKVINLGPETTIEKQYYFYICKKEIIVHQCAEEKIFYCFLKQVLTQQDLGFFAPTVDHNEIENNLTLLSKPSIQDSEWHEQFTTMSQALEKHMGEETSALFNLANEVLSVTDAKFLAVKMKQQKEIEEKSFLEKTGIKFKFN